MTPEAFRALYGVRASRVRQVAKLATRDVLLAVERQATKNLSGSGPPGGYPVPVRTGNLRRSMGVRQESEVVGYVFNKARYANAIHRGMTPYNNPHAKKSYVGRPFLDDAVAKTNVMQVFQRRFVKLWESRA